MLENLDVYNILFLDIETVSAKPTFDDISDDFKPLWKKKSRSILRVKEEDLTDEMVTDAYTNRAAIFAEFGKIVCISVGFLSKREDGEMMIRLTSFASDDERQLLLDFAEMLNKHYNLPSKHSICGHNLREFDVPYICRRMIVNRVPFPNLLKISGKKPWETKHLLDTLEMWKFGDYKNYTSIKVLTALLDLPSPKDDIDGSEVGGVYWKENDLKRIAVYCEKDVLACAQLLLRYNLQPKLEDSQVEHV